MYCKVIIRFIVIYIYDFVHFKTKFEGHQTDFASLVRDKFCLISIIYCFVSVSFNFSVLLCLFFHNRGGDEREVRFLY